MAVLEAAAVMMLQRGYEHLTVEGIASSAGVGKQTVYRWWGSKADVVVEAIAEGYLEVPIDLPGDTGDLRRDLETWLREIKAAVEQGESSRLAQAIVAALASAGERSRAIHRTLIQPLQHAIEARFRAHEHIHPGTLPAPAPFLAETVGASLLLHVLFAEPLAEDWIAQLLDLVAPVR